MSDDDDTCAGQSDGLIPGIPKKRIKFWGCKNLKRCLYDGAVAVLAGSYIATFFIGRHSFTDKELDKSCMYRTSPYSPILAHMDPTPKLTQFNGTLEYPSEYTGDPSPEVDAAWDKWGYVKYASIPEDEFLKLPGAVEHFQDAACLTPEYGGGYIGFLEFSHHMHCLNMLSQGNHQDYYNSPEKPEQMTPGFTDRPFTVRAHLPEHCIEILRQNVMCNADVERWIKDNQIPDTPDGSDLPIPLGSKSFAKPPWINAK